MPTLALRTSALTLSLPQDQQYSTAFQAGNRLEKLWNSVAAESQ